MVELKQSMVRLGLTVNDKELETILKEVDQDGNGEIDFNEFCSVMHRMVKNKVTWDEIIKQCFEVFDQVHTICQKLLCRLQCVFEPKLQKNVFNTQVQIVKILLNT